VSRPGLRWSVGAAAVALAVLLAPSPALAHGSMKAGEFYAGLSECVFHPESLFVVLAVLLWGSQQGETSLLRVPWTFAGAVGVGSAVASLGWDLPGGVWIARGGTLVLGLLVAARLGVPLAAGVAVAAVLGVAAGHAATWPDRAALVRPWLYALGLSTAVVVGWGYVASFALRFRAFWAEIAIRIAGSWIATVTLLVSVLAIAKR